MRATVLTPTHDHGPLLEHAVASALDQSHTDFELFIIGDGVDEATRAAAERLVETDPRVSFFDYPKSPRLGEPYRHELLTTRASGEIVCYLCDDDLWLPGHLADMVEAMRTYNCVHSAHAHVTREMIVGFHWVDWSDPWWVNWTISPPRNNGVGLSQGGHRMDFYRGSGLKWDTTPVDEWGDHFMWKKLLSHPDCRPGSTGKHTVLQFPSPMRSDWPMEQRLAELGRWSELMRSDLDALRGHLEWQWGIWLHYNPNELIEETPEFAARTELCPRAAAATTELQSVRDELAQAEQALGETRSNNDQLQTENEALKDRLSDAKGELEERQRLIDRWENAPKWFRSLSKRLGVEP